jgi:hypothetical protein
MFGAVDYSRVPAVMTQFTRVGSDVMALPFDMARAQYVQSVRAGLVERSLIASARFERVISALECFTLGGMARRY